MLNFNNNKLLLNSNNNSKIKEINNKPHKLDYEAIKNIVQEGSSNLRIEPSHKLHIRQMKLR